VKLKPGAATETQPIDSHATPPNLSQEVMGQRRSAGGGTSREGGGASPGCRLGGVMKKMATSQIQAEADN